MHCGKIISVAISFLKNASLPGLLDIEENLVISQFYTVEGMESFMVYFVKDEIRSFKKIR